MLRHSLSSLGLDPAMTRGEQSFYPTSSDVVADTSCKAVHEKSQDAACKHDLTQALSNAYTIRTEEYPGVRSGQLAPSGDCDTPDPQIAIKQKSPVNLPPCRTRITDCPINDFNTR